LLQVSYGIAAFRTSKLAPPIEAAPERWDREAKFQPPIW